MSYWGSGPADNDYAFGAVGVYVLLIKDRMFQDANVVLEASHPEQGIVASVRCLRLLAAEFRKCVRVHFRKKELAKARELFDRWFEAAKARIPKKHREVIRAEATEEFDLFEKEVLT
jgi:hypothetical protein